MLPTKLVMLNVNFNKLRTQGVKANAFKVSQFHTLVSRQIFQCFYSAHLIIPSCGLFFQKLTRLAYLYLGNNELTGVPLLPESLYVVHLHVSLLTFECNHYYSVQSNLFWRCLLVLSFLQNNKISSITDQTFCKGNSSHYIRPNMDQVRLDGNPIRLWDYPYSFICLHSLPMGWYWNDHSKSYIGVNKGIGQRSRIEWGLYIKAEDESRKQHLK